MQVNAVPLPGMLIGTPHFIRKMFVEIIQNKMISKLSSVLIWVKNCWAIVEEEERGKLSSFKCVL